MQLKDIPSDTMSKIKVATLGNSDDIKVGQQVIAIGNALGYGQSVTVGYVSALDREITDEKGLTGPSSRQMQPSTRATAAAPLLI